jgi:predicted XRE-type DNA-binding protein
MKNNYSKSKNPAELAEALGLSPLDAAEWRIRYLLTKQIIESFNKNKLTVTKVAKEVGTSRARITNILKGDSTGISIDILIRVLTVLGNQIKISFKKVA